jgi:hypothetical protein
MRWRLATAVLAASWICLAGCSEDLGNRQPIEGQVTLGGQPLDGGAIEFTPLEDTQEQTRSGAPITAGKYSIPRENGLLPGKYRVRITAGTEAEPLPAGELPGPTGPGGKERVPPEFNIKSEIEANVTTGTNMFNYDIP